MHLKQTGNVSATFLGAQSVTLNKFCAPHGRRRVTIGCGIVTKSRMIWFARDGVFQGSPFAIPEVCHSGRTPALRRALGRSHGRSGGSGRSSGQTGSSVWGLQKCSAAEGGPQGFFRIIKNQGGGGPLPQNPLPPSPDQSDHSGKKRNLQ